MSIATAILLVWACAIISFVLGAVTWTSANAHKDADRILYAMLKTVALMAWAVCLLCVGILVYQAIKG